MLFDGVKGILLGPQTPLDPAQLEGSQRQDHVLSHLDDPWRDDQGLAASELFDLLRGFDFSLVTKAFL
jgi:hypothetical protein